MKVYLDLSNQKRQGSITRVVNCVKQRTPKRPGLVIVNTDLDYGMYVKELNRIFKSIGMVEQSPIFRKKGLSCVNTGDFIVVGEDNAYHSFDFRVEEDQQLVEELDGRRFKAYDLIDDWNAIINKLSKYGKFTLNRGVFGKASFRPEQVQVEVEVEIERKAERFARPSLLDLRVEAPAFECPYAKKQVDYTEIFRPVRREEKITIFDNWVKIGMRSFDIFYDMFGREQVKVDGSSLYVKSDRLGRKYLAIR